MMCLIVARCLVLNNKRTWFLPAIFASASFLPQVVLAQTSVMEPAAQSVPDELPQGNIDRDSDPDDLRLHADQVWHGGRWLDIFELNESMMTPPLKRYIKERGEGVLDIVGHRRLANWAEDHDMKLQAQSHWFGVLAFSPNDEVARTKLQFELVNGEWLTKDEINEAESTAKERLKQTKIWMPKMKVLANSLLGSDAKSKMKSLDTLKKISDPTAVAAMQITALQLPGDMAVPFVNAIKNVRTKEACGALVNIAVEDPSSKRGQAAIASLKEYPMVFYVPEMIESLSSDTELRHRVFTRPSGEMVLRQVQSKEFRDLERISVLDVVVSSDRTIDVSQSATRNRGRRTTTMLARAEKDGIAQRIALRDAERELYRNQEAVGTTNLQDKVKQDRVLDVLRGCSGESLDRNPVAWWVWWDQKNEETRIGSKSYATSYQEDRRNTLYPSDVRYAGTMPSIARSTPPAPPAGRCECLIRGTMIQTETGLRAVETIRTGDLVLAQDIESGTLALKPVLNTTLRPPTKTLRFTTKAGPIQATLGHYWWVDGCGWLRSKELAVGMPLHLAKGTAKIEAIEEVSEEVETFNLVVADYHTYFVGPEHILSNDATELRPTMKASPGAPELVKVFVSK